MISLKRRVENFSVLYSRIREVFYGLSNCGFDIDEKYSKFLGKIIDCKSDKEYYLTVAQFVNLFNDGHTNFTMPKKFLAKVGYLPFDLIYIEKDYYINNGLENCSLTRIKTINGKPFIYFKKLSFKYIHNVDGFAYHSRIESVLPLFLKKKNNVIVLEDGLTIKFDLLESNPVFSKKSKLLSSKPNKNISSQNVFALRFDDDIIYLKIDTFANKTIVDECVNILRKNKNAKHVILDVRENEGGMTKNAERIANLFIEGRYFACKKFTRENVGIDLASASQYNLSKEKIAQWIASGLTTKEKVEESLKVLNGGNLKEYTDCFGEEKRQTMQCNCVILTSKYTISASEDFVAMFKTNNVGKIIGDYTYGSTGTPYVVKFNDGSSARVCSVYYKLLNGEDFINKGIKPDIFLTNSVEDYKNCIDSVLDKTIDLINKWGENEGNKS